MALLRYLLVGVANTIVGLGVMYSAMYFLQLNVIDANALGYTIGVVCSFVLNKKWTFKSDDRLLVSFLRFIVVLAIAYVANLVTLVLLVDTLQVNLYVAQALAIIPYTTIGFLGSRFFAFKNQQSTQSSYEKQRQSY